MRGLQDRQAARGNTKIREIRLQQALQAGREPPAPWAPRDPKGTQASLDLKDLPVPEETQVHKGLRERPGRRGHGVLRDPRVLKGLLDHRVCRGSRGRRERPGLKALTALA
jgi:hypothetical protein